MMVEEQLGVVRGDDGEAYDNELQKILGNYGLTSICPSTIYRWMNLLGFKYEQRRKCYYVYGHKKSATVEYCKAFVEYYLTYEHQMFHWIQVTITKSQVMGKKRVSTIKNS